MGLERGLSTLRELMAAARYRAVLLPHRVSKTDSFNQLGRFDVCALPTAARPVAPPAGLRSVERLLRSSREGAASPEHLGGGAAGISPASPPEGPAQGQAALARPKPADPRVAERFELYACGVELANAFGELTDPAEQRRRFEAEMDEKARIYGERYPIDEDFLSALAHMPPASGSALGFDRLVMLATGAQRIEQVVWTPVAEI